jgi:epoxyqueuosine reductase
MNLSEQIRNYAYSLGFSIVKIIPADPSFEDGKYFEEWLKNDYAGELEYMKKTPEKRFYPEKILPGAKSIICFAMNYYQPLPCPDNPEFGRVARYAWGKDYHSVIEKKLKKIRKYILENTEAKIQNFKLYTDAGPFLERSYAAKARTGFIGKNTALITKDFGSWVLLSEIITTLKLDYDFSDKKYFGECGECTKCIDSCPTKAIIKPYLIDARRCISYQTIENKKEIHPEIMKKMGNRIFGCDICQEVCPHNCRAKTTTIPEFLSHIAGPYINPVEIINLDEDQFKEKYKGSPIKRPGYKGITRNIKHML